MSSADSFRSDSPVRVLAIADTDSYLKWSVATLGALPDGWVREQVLVRNPVAPSLPQVRAGAGRAVPAYDLLRLLAVVARLRPDVVLLACTGPVVEVLTGLPGLGRGHRRPVLVTGLPGVHVPPTVRAVRHRAGCDLFLAHSHVEVAGVAALTEAHAPGLQVALTQLPFLAAPSGPEGGSMGRVHARKPTSPGTEVVFAAQAQVPATRADREAVLRALAELEPAGSAVVKLRAAGHERQTHHEQWPYDVLWSDLVSRGEVPAGRVRFRTGSMGEALDRARALVTVSSTAALEAIARGVPVGVLRDFGMSPELLNEVFADSGCLASLADVRAGRFGVPDPAWRHANYFHPATDDDAEPRLRTLLAQRASGGLSPRPRTGWSRRRLRWWARLLLPSAGPRHGRAFGARKITASQHQVAELADRPVPARP